MSDTLDFLCNINFCIIFEYNRKQLSDVNREKEDGSSISLDLFNFSLNNLFVCLGWCH